MKKLKEILVEISLLAIGIVLLCLLYLLKQNYRDYVKGDGQDHIDFYASTFLDSAIQYVVALPVMLPIIFVILIIICMRLSSLIKSNKE